MKKEVYVAPSTLPIANYQDILEYAKEMQNFADFLHCDVTDGVFVDSKNYDASLVKTINSNSLIPLDVHLMVKEPYDQIEDYLNAGANILTLHYEAFKDKNKLADAIKKIKEYGVLAGLALNPNTTLKEAKSFIYTIDVVLLMTEEAGYGNQKFAPKNRGKIIEFREFRKENNLNFKIEVDGGVNASNAKELRELGADIIVSGSYIYNSADRKAAVELLKG